MDTAFTTLDRDAQGRAWASLDSSGGDAGAALWADPGFGYLMVYTGDTLGEVPRRRRAVAIEPMTCPPNALRTGKDLISLQPGQRWSASWGLVPR
jgi:aldose 1-epimerase